MADVLICSLDDVGPTLGGTILWRQQFGRHVARSADEARRLAASVKPVLVLVDRDLPWAEDIVKWVRQQAVSRRSSIAVVAGGDFASSELGLLEAGANAVLRLPPDGEWDVRLARLLRVSGRREARVPVHIQLEASMGAAGAPFTATTMNVSETGMLIQSQTALEIGSEIVFAFQLPGTPGMVAGRARVVRIAGSREFGLEFADLEGDAVGRLRTYVRSQPG